MSNPVTPTGTRKRNVFQVVYSTDGGGEGEGGSWFDVIGGVMGLFGALGRLAWGLSGTRSTPSTPPTLSQPTTPSVHEHIELTHLDLQNPCYLRVEGSLPGVGHKFQPTTLDRPTWCDACAHLVFYHGSTCSNCSLICHEQCRDVVSLDCEATCSCNSSSSHDEEGSIEEFILDADDEQPGEEVRCQLEEEEAKKDKEEASTGEGNGEEMTAMATLKLEEESTLRRSVRRLHAQTMESQEVEEWVRKCDSSHQGLQITKEADGSYRGCLRVHFNMNRPINIIAGTRPPSIYDILQEDKTLEKTLTSFYMPRDSVKAIHITSTTTTREVIVALLKKFKVADNPQKFALYERTIETGQSVRAKLRKLADAECPLGLAIKWSAENQTSKRIVLQENDTGDIQWDAFSFPELCNFLRILDKEEEEYRNQIKDKYYVLKLRIQDQMERRKTAAS